MVELGSRSSREISDYHLSRFACYLIAQNGDPRKPEIANAQKYFAIQARRQEISEKINADIERLELRKQTSEEFKALSGAGRDAGVQDKMFGVRRCTLLKKKACINPKNAFKSNHLSSLKVIFVLKNLLILNNNEGVYEIF